MGSIRYFLYGQNGLNLCVPRKKTHSEDLLTVSSASGLNEGASFMVEQARRICMIDAVNGLNEEVLLHSVKIYI